MATSIFSNTNFISIPEGGVSAPYPSIINVSGTSGSLTKLTVTLTNLNHAYASDIDVLLVSPTGANSILMSDVGGSSDLTNVTLTFDATATSSLSDFDGISSGTYRPTNFDFDFDDPDFFDFPAPDGPYNADLSVFNDTEPNGEWQLYILDDFVGDSGNVAGGWSISIETEESIINGDDSNNTLEGNISNNTINGIGGNDTLKGSAGNDTLDGGAGNDTADYSQLGQSITLSPLSPTGIITKGGGLGNDQLISVEKIIADASAVNNTIDVSTAGNAASINVNLQTQQLTVNGLPGVGTFTVTNFDHVQGTSQNDTIIGDSQNNQLSGNAGNDSLNGGAGNDTLNGGAGTDTLIGGLGDDIYIIDSATDTITENANEGTDTIQSSFTYSIAARTNFENLTLTGTTAINGTGNVGNNIISGNGGNNTLNGGAGNDTLDGGGGIDALIGGTGNDIYIVDSNTDIIAENANEGTDTIQSSVTYSIAAKTNIENLTLTGTAAINGTGNVANNVITGNSANNTLNGGAGNDTLDGGAGTDTLIGGLGNDSLYLGLNDTAVDNVNYVLGDGTDTVYQFVRGVGGDKLNFAGIANFDVRTLGANTEIRVGDGTGGNLGFGTGQLLVTLSGTSGFTNANANVNLFGGAFLFN